VKVAPANARIAGGLRAIQTPVRSCLGAGLPGAAGGAVWALRTPANAKAAAGNMNCRRLRAILVFEELEGLAVGADQFTDPQRMCAVLRGISSDGDHVSGLQGALAPTGSR